jgi:hypothetical protein
MMIIEVEVGDLEQRIGDDQAQVRYSVVGRSGSRVFRFSLKTGGDGLSVVWPQNHCDDLLVWASKPRAVVW